MASGSGFSMEEFESLMATSDVELLKRAWRNEKSAPEILQFQSSLVLRSREQIQLMEETIEEFTKSGFDPLIVSIYQMDMDRAQYMCYENMKSYLDESVLSKLPTGYQSDLKQSNASEENDMGSFLYSSYVPEPNLDTFVFCKSDSSIGAIPLDDSADEIVDLVAGDLYVLRYKSIKPFVENGQVDLV
uniref:DNA replication complex GINS protein SLD5 n=1 Tax=Chenopodium quinoa TaxID=63459 RepID=A0A803N2B0_CHEQI